LATRSKHVRRYNFKSTKKQKLDTDEDEEEDGDIEESVKTITAMLKVNDGIPSSLELRNYGDPLKKLVAAIAHVNTSSTPIVYYEHEGNHVNSDEDDSESTSPETCQQTSIVSASSEGDSSPPSITPDVPSGDISAFSVPLRMRKVRDPVAGIGLKRKR
jgi:hypothetical protein